MWGQYFKPVNISLISSVNANPVKLVEVKKKVSINHRQLIGRKPKTSENPATL